VKTPGLLMETRRVPPRAAIAVAVIGAVLHAPALAQSKVLEVVGPPGALIGGSFAVAGDIDNDGVPDYLVGDPVRHSGGEVVVLFSGADGSVLHTFQTPQVLIQYGISLAGGMDINNDSVPDIIIGANWGSPGFPSSDTGAVFVYSGATYGLIQQDAGSVGENLGFPVEFLDDLNGDAIAEYAAGATHDGIINAPDEVGEVYVYSGASGGIVHHLSNGAPGDRFGYSFASIGDITQDGVSDFCVGAPSASTLGFFLNGAVYLYSGLSGQVIRKDEGIGDVASYGFALAATGDVDLDGTPDYVTTSWDVINGAAVVSGATGVVLTYIQSPMADGFTYGPSHRIDTIADVEGDGIREVLVRYYDGNSPRHLLVASATDGDPLYYLLDDLGFGSSFPGVSANAGDRDGDGWDEIATSNGTNGASIYSTRLLVASPTGIPAATGGAANFDLNAGVPHAGSQYFLLASLTPAGVGSCSGIPIGATEIPLCFDLLMDFSIFLANIPPFVNTAGLLDPTTGKATAAFDLTGVPLPPSTVGISLWFAYIAKGGQVQEAGGPWTLASNPAAVVIL